jgi:hypothetical protein
MIERVIAYNSDGSTDRSKAGPEAGPVIGSHILTVYVGFICTYCTVRQLYPVEGFVGLGKCCCYYKMGELISMICDTEYNNLLQVYSTVRVPCPLPAVIICSCSITFTSRATLLATPGAPFYLSGKFQQPC